MYEVKVLEEAEKVIKKWKKSNPQLFKKYQKIFHELADHPRTGIGHPEALKGGNDITYSRHITAHDRIIYDIYDENAGCISHRNRGALQRQVVINPR